MHKFTHNFFRKLQSRGTARKTIKYRRDRCFMQLAIGGKEVGTIEIQLYFDDLPKTCENFRCLCTGEKGIGKVYKKELTYKGCGFHRLIPNFMVQGGDFTHHNGCGGESIYGIQFADEGFMYKHSRPGLLSMANSGPNTNQSQFFITLAPCPHLDNVHVVFGEITKGIEIITQLIDRLECSGHDKPKLPITIVDCGMVRIDDGSDDDENGIPPEERAKKLEEEASSRQAQTLENVSSALAVGLNKRKRSAEGEDENSESDEENETKKRKPAPNAGIKKTFDLNVGLDDSDSDK